MIPSHVSATAMWHSAIRQLLKAPATGSRNGASREVFGWAGKLLDPTRSFVQNPVRKASPSYAAAELLWYFSGKRTIERLLPYAPSYKKFANEGEAKGAYGDRWNRQIGFVQKMNFNGSRFASQLHAVARLLRDKPDSRQAIVTMWDSGDLIEAIRGEWKDLPCTIAMQFRVGADSRLHAATFMRSNDAWLGLPYDVFCFTSVQRAIAGELNLPVGEYSHQVGSMHLYEKDAASAEAAMMHGGADCGAEPQATFAVTLQQMEAACFAEARVRDMVDSRSTVMADGKIATLMPDEQRFFGNVRAVDSFCVDLTRCCARKLLGRNIADALVGPVGSKQLSAGCDIKGE